MTSINTAVTLLAARASPAAGSSGFSRAVAGTGPVFLAFLAIHVPAGLTAVISGALAATAPKRRGRHTGAGTVYYWAITVVFATAAAMAAIRPARDWYLALLGALAFILAAAGRDYRRHPARRPWRRWPGHIPHIITMGTSYTVLLTAFYVDNGKNLPLWDRLPTAAYWTLPTLVAAPIIARSAIRHRRPRQAPSSQGTSRLETADGPTPRRPASRHASRDSRVQRVRSRKRCWSPRWWLILTRCVPSVEPERQVPEPELRVF